MTGKQYPHRCDECNYEWKGYKEKPLSCPRCKRRFDYPKEE